MAIHEDSTVTALPRVGRAVMGFALQNDEFIADKVLPYAFTPDEAGQITTIKRESITARTSVKRAAGAAYARDSIELKGNNFTCISRGHEQKLPDEHRGRYATLFDAYKAKGEIGARRCLLDREVDVKELVFNTTTFTGSALFKDNSSAPWATVGTDIIGQVFDAKAKVRANCGMKANSMVFGEALVKGLITNTAIKAAMSSITDKSEEAIRNFLSALFGIKNIIIGGAIYNSADEGQTFVGADVWGDTYVNVFYAPVSADPEEPGLGRIWQWTELAGASQGVKISRYRENQTDSDIIKAQMSSDEVIHDAMFGHLMQVKA